MHSNAFFLFFFPFLFQHLRAIATGGGGRAIDSLTKAQQGFTMSIYSFFFFFFSFLSLLEHSRVEDHYVIHILQDPL